jgi:hypothetical protein
MGFCKDKTFSRLLQPPNPPWSHQHLQRASTHHPAYLPPLVRDRCAIRGGGFGTLLIMGRTGWRSGGRGPAAAGCADGTCRRRTAGGFARPPRQTEEGGPAGPRASSSERVIGCLGLEKR